VPDIRRYLAEIGRRGGTKSRRTLDPETARAMVRARELSRAMRTGDADAVQDAIWRRQTPAEKLAVVAGLSRTVHALAVSGIRMRHPSTDADAVRLLLLEQLHGREVMQRIQERGRSSD
jgi:hypothetical protein